MEPRPGADAIASAAREDGTGWLSAHLFYQGELDDLLTQAVAPLVRDLAADELIDDYFFLRYWQGGPHVRLRLLPADGARLTDIESRVTERAGAYFLAHPSADRMLPEEYRRMATVLADGERLTAYNERMYPNNSLAFLPYRREHHIYGYGPSITAVERHFGESSRIAMAMLTAGTSADRRHTAAYCMLLLGWSIAAATPGVEKTTAGERDGSWGYGFDLGALGVDPAEFEARYQQQRDQLIALAWRMRLAADRSATAAEPGVLAEWGRSASRLRDSVAERAPAVLDMCAHLLCNRLGISLTEEFYLRHLASRAMAATFTERSDQNGMA